MLEPWLREHAHLLLRQALRVPWWSWVLQVVGVVSSYVGAELNARLRIEGFYVWLASNATLLVVHLISGLWALAVLDVLYFRINLTGIAHWRKQPPAKADGSRVSTLLS